MAERMAAQLRLGSPPTPWHTRRGPLLGLTGAAAIYAGVLRKIARDLSLLMQLEIGEVAEPGGAGRGGSSTMPHKRNPTASMIALAAAGRAPSLQATLLAGMVQEHERAVGGWQAEAPTIGALFEATHAALLAMIEAIEELTVHPDAMLANLAALRGLPLAEQLMLAMAPKLGRGAAQALVEVLCARALADDRALVEVAGAEAEVLAHLSLAEITALLDPGTYLGCVETFIDRALDRARRSPIMGKG